MSKARHARPTRSKTATRVALTAGLGVGMAVAATATASATGDYTVKKGDTLSEIAQQYHTSWQTLARINQLRNPDLILIGQQLELSGPATSGTTLRKSQREYGGAAAAPRHRTRGTNSGGTVSRSGSASLSGAWRKVAQCESGGNPRAVNGAGYYGLFQFDLQTWRSVGGSGNPANASASEQYSRAKALYAQRGAAPWPVCGRYLR